MQPPEVVVIGNIGIDTNVFSHSGVIDFSVESNFTENLDYIGQAGGYTSRGYAQLGRRTAFIGHVGDDANGHFIRATLARDGIETTALFTDPAGTARSINFMGRDGRRKNFYDGKGHMSLEPDLNACRQALTGARLAHCHLPNWARRLLPLARELGLTIACDIQDVVKLDDPYRQDFIQAADILFFSAANHPDPTPLIDACLRRRRDQIIIVGRGAHGCALGTQDGIEFFPPVTLDLPLVDTNGAGDGLAVGFLSSFVLDGYPIRAAIRRGQITARYTCSLKATTDRLISADQLDAYFQELADS